MTRGPLVVFGLLGSVGLITGIILLGFVLVRPEAAPCARGELAENEVVGGVVQPREERFGSVTQAEAFICHGLPHPAEQGGWVIQDITAERSAPLEHTVRGIGSAYVHLAYTQPHTGDGFLLSATPLAFFDALEGYEAQEPVPFMEGMAQVSRSRDDADSVAIEWRYRSLEYRVTSTLDDDFRLEDLLAVLETIE